MTEEALYTDQGGASPELDSRPEGHGEDRGASLVMTVTHLAFRKWLIARVTGAATLVGLILCSALPVRYTAVTKIMPPKQTQSTTTFLSSQVAGMGALGDAAGGLGLKDPNAIYIGLLRSRLVTDTIIERFGLMKAYHSKDMTAARKKLDENTEVVSEKSTLISVSVTDKDKKRAAAMANTYTEQLRVLTKTISVTEASRRRLFFEDQLKSQKEVLIGAESAFQELQQDKGLVHLEAQSGVLIEGLANLRANIAAKQVELQAIRSYSTDRNPDVLLAERELSTMQSEAAQMEHHNSPAGFSEMGLKDVPKAGLDYIRASRELQYQQAFFDLLLRQYEAARLDEAKEAAVIQVVEPAIEPDRKSAPKRMAIVMVLTVFGFFSGCLFARFRDWIESAQADPERAPELRNLKEAFMAKKDRGPEEAILKSCLSNSEDYGQ